MIVALHVATGALAGAATGSRLAAALLGPVLRAAGDRMPHEDFPSHAFEAATGIALLLALAARRGVLDPATIGGAVASAPDLEHVLPLPRPGGRKLFPSHRIVGFHRSGGPSAAAQLAIAAGLVAVLVARR